MLRHLLVARLLLTRVLLLQRLGTRRNREAGGGGEKEREGDEGGAEGV